MPPQSSLFAEKREAYTYDPQLTEDFCSREIFDDLLYHKGAAASFDRDCEELADQNLQQLQQRFNNTFAEVFSMARMKYQAYSSQHNWKPGKKADKWQEIDQLFADVLESFMPRLLPVVVSVINKVLNIQLYDVQIIAGLQLYEGNVLEMKTGEGKTFVIPIAAIFFGLRARLLHTIYLRDVEADGYVIPSHYRFQVKVVTANDYLARRDYSLLHPVYELFDLSSYYIQEVYGGRDSAYYFSFDVLYCTCRHLCH